MRSCPVHSVGPRWERRWSLHERTVEQQLPTQTMRLQFQLQEH